jgi:hypothetical protein
VCLSICPLKGLGRDIKRKEKGFLGRSVIKKPERSKVCSFARRKDKER